MKKKRAVTVDAGLLTRAKRSARTRGISLASCIERSPTEEGALSVASSLLVAPVSAALLAWLLLAEPLGPIQIVGMVVVLAGVQLAWRAHDAQSNRR